jgi:hypothetical protein
MANGGIIGPVNDPTILRFNTDLHHQVTLISQLWNQARLTI